MNENKMELQDNQDSLDEAAKQVSIQCPYCQSGSVRVASPIAMYVGRPFAMTSPRVVVRYGAGVALGRCSQCKRPVPISPCAIVSPEEHAYLISQQILNKKGGKKNEKN